MSALTPPERERLEIFLTAQLARTVRDRGMRLNAPEATALIADEMHLAARAEGSYEQVRAAGISALAPEEVLDGVAEIVEQVRVEVLLEDGTRLVVLDAPLGCGPGSVTSPDEPVRLLPGRERRRLTVENTGTQAVRVSSHYPFERANPRLRFDREAAQGFHLDVPAGELVAWAPGETKDVELVRGTAAGDGDG